jgi:hypothetical protein
MGRLVILFRRGMIGGLLWRLRFRLGGLRRMGMIGIEIWRVFLGVRLRLCFGSRGLIRLVRIRLGFFLVIRIL